METIKIADAVRILGIRPQAVYAAIKKKRLKGEIVKNRWNFTLNNITEYLKIKYSRVTERDSKGNLIFDLEKGICSPRQAAEITKVPEARIYYAIRTGKISAKRRKKCAYVLDIKEVERFIKEKAGLK